ncbi:MAG: acyl-CoA dehydrogenase [Gammaproteobacteria bacterium]|nr:acyl-CoA dehydrogenase [Gammaproteobacteria bacterium]
MNEAQTILDDSLSRFFADSIDREYLTRLEEISWDDALWSRCIEQGLGLVLVSETQGGMGGSWLEAFIVARACGRYAVPLPIPEQILAGWLTETAGLAPRAGVAGILPEVIATAAVAGDRATFTAERVPWGRHAEHFIGLTTDSELVVLDRANTKAITEANLAREPRDKISFEATPILARAKVALPASGVRWLGALLRSAQIAGAATACLELSVKYTSEREQFGRALSQFQAIQQQLAELAGAMASVDTIAMAACLALDERGLASAGRDAKFEIASAKCRASEAVEPITRISHQVHGAIGFTYEYDLQFLTRRLWSWRAEFGANGEWGEYLGQVALQEGGDNLWRYLTA